MSNVAMNAERLLKHYEKIADAPDAIVRLRRFVLDLAVRGKLVPQHPKDEPAPELLKRIAKEKLHQASLPRGWRRAKIGSILELQYGKGLKATERSEEGPVPVFGSNGIVGFTDEPLTARPSIIVGRKGSAGALNLCDGPSWTTDVAYFVEVPSFLDVRFTLNALAALDLDKLGKGVKPGLSRSEAYDQIIAVPPLAEQHRIVAKVDELMGLCDRLEAARQTREAVRDRLTAASLARLNTPDPQTFQEDAQFALDALPALTTRPDQIKALRQTILNLAVRGKLVPQDANDEPASELLKRLKRARTALEATGKIRKEKGEPPSHYCGEQGFDLPSSWSWARLTEIGQTQTGTSPSSANPDLFGGFIPFIKPAHLDGKKINYDGQGLSEIGIASSRLAAANSILMVCIGATLGKVNTTARPVCFNQQINSLTPFLNGLTAFGALALKTSEFQSLAWSKAGTGTLPIISKGKWEVLPIPLPPLAEQQRIVAKVDALVALCDRLEASLAATAATRRRLLDALLAEALAPVEDRELEAAE
jgi:type I restriction enzyme S subunit